jgi:hypothetical protein
MSGDFQSMVRLTKHNGTQTKGCVVGAIDRIFLVGKARNAGYGPKSFFHHDGHVVGNVGKYRRTNKTVRMLSTSGKDSGPAGYRLVDMAQYMGTLAVVNHRSDFGAFFQSMTGGEFVGFLGKNSFEFVGDGFVNVNAFCTHANLAGIAKAIVCRKGSCLL